MATPQSTSDADRKHATIGCITISIIFILTFASCALIIDCRDRQERERRQEAINKEIEKFQQDFERDLAAVQYTPEQVALQDAYFSRCLTGEASRNKESKDMTVQIWEAMQDESNHNAWIAMRLTAMVFCEDAGYGIDPPDIFESAR